MQRSQAGDSLAGQNNPPPAPSRPLGNFQPRSATISRPPVRYTLPPPPEHIPEPEIETELAQMEQDEEVTDEGATRSSRPGQKGFAERLLSKYGWTKGSGLGATGSGMVKPLQVQVEKRKKRPDSEGGGFVTPAGRGKIIGSNKTSQYESKFGPMCEVIVLRGMLDGIDIDSELENSQDGGLMQEIGEECDEKVRFRCLSICWVVYSLVCSMEPWSEFLSLATLAPRSRSLSNSSVHCLLYG